MAAEPRPRRLGIDFFALVAAGGVIVGAHAPAATVKMHGEVSFADIAEGQALTVAAVAASTLLVVVSKRYGWLWLVSLAVWTVLAWPIIENQMQSDPHPLSETFRKMTDPVTKPVGEAAGNHALDYVSLSWGGFALLGGCLLLPWTAWRVVRRRRKPT